MSINLSNSGLLMGSRSRRFLIAAAALSICMYDLAASASATGDAPRTSQSDGRIAFDIAAQPLEDALYAFGAITGIEVFVDGGAVMGRRSGEVKGAFTVSQAIRLLLVGTGLEPQSIGVRAITLMQPRGGELSSVAAYKRYSGLLQSAAVRRLCGERDAAAADLGNYRIAMQIWLAGSGGVRDVELLSSTGDRLRDERIRALLLGLQVERPPPGLPQPVVMVVLPRQPRDSGDCVSRAGP